uniref:Protein Nef n=1 Tax=Human immunodeficiency virus 2 TaxID=11709 RepID=B9VR83_9HIV2|nr:nef protein [Human immunodeficiency virus 2]
MGASGSKKHSRPSRGLAERLVRARAEACGGRCDALGGENSRFQEESGRGQSSPSCEGRQNHQGEYADRPWRNPINGETERLVWGAEQGDVDSDDDDLVGVPVTSRTQLREMTYKFAIDMSHLIKDKGGLEGMYYSEGRREIIDLYLEKEEGIIPDWQNYTSGPGIRYPMFHGWLWKLVPVDVPQEREDTETHCLMHPAQTGRFDDKHGETLMWKFDPTLAYDYAAFRLYPEEFGHKSGLPEEEWKARLKARGIPFN